MSILNHVVAAKRTSPANTNNIRHFCSTIARLYAYLCLAHQVKKERRALQKISAETLQDIGINRQSAITESRRAFSDIPQNRRPDLKPEN